MEHRISAEILVTGHSVLCTMSTHLTALCKAGSTVLYSFMVTYKPVGTLGIPRYTIYTSVYITNT